MKKIIYAALAVCLLASFSACSLLPGAGGDRTEPEKTQTVTSPESALTMQFPAQWEQNDELHEEASIKMNLMSNEMYMIVLEESAEDFADDFTLVAYADVIQTSMLGQLTNGETTEVGDTTVGESLAALQFELTGEVNKIKVRYQITCFRTDETFYQVIAWSLKSRYDDAVPVFNDILQSVSIA